MGARDPVVQVESRGVIPPKFRRDLLQERGRGRAHAKGEIETTVVPAAFTNEAGGRVLVAPFGIPSVA